MATRTLPSADAGPPLAPRLLSGPLSRRIADALADAILRGEHAVGDRLPSEFDLGRRYGASRFTIREALAELRARGLVASRRGSGTVVLRAAPQAPAFRESHGSIEDFLASVVAAPLHALELRDVVADAALAAELRCEPGRQFLLFRGERRRAAAPSDAPPLALTEAYIDPGYAPGLRPHLFALIESIAATAERVLGVRVRSIVQELEPVLLDAAQAARLAAPGGGPAMLVRRWYRLDDAATLIASRSLYPQGRAVFRTELRREAAAAAAPG